MVVEAHWMISILILFHVLSFNLCKPAQKLITTENVTWSAALYPWLPRENNNMAICHHDDIIYLFGGYDSHQLVLYNISNGEIYDNGTNATYPYKIHGDGTFYTQNNSICYFIVNAGDTIISYDLVNNEYGESITIKPNASYDSYSGSCLASYNNMLFVVGGTGVNAKPLNTLQIYDISSNQWSSGPTMHVPRFSLSCIVNPKSAELYAIGGRYHGAAQISIEKILIDHIMYTEWQYIDNLLYPTQKSRVILQDNIIWVIGGWNKNDGQLRRIQLINCTNGNVSSRGYYLNYSVESTAAILVNQRMYAFGGDNHYVLKTWQYWDVPSTNDLNANHFDYMSLIISVALICGLICVCWIGCCWKYRKRKFRQQQRRYFTFSGMNQVQAK